MQEFESTFLSFCKKWNFELFCVQISLVFHCFRRLISSRPIKCKYFDLGPALWLRLKVCHFTCRSYSKFCKKKKKKKKPSVSSKTSFTTFLYSHNDLSLTGPATPSTPLLQKTPKQKAAERWITVEIVIVFFGASFGSLYVLVFPHYIRDKLAHNRNFTMIIKGDVEDHNGTCYDRNITTNPDYAIQQEIAAETSHWVMLGTTLSYIPALFISVIYGALGDNLGRKVHLLIPCIGGFLCICCMLVVLYLDLPLSYYVSANVLYGLGGGYQFLMVGCSAYVADITVTEKARLMRITTVQAVLLGTMSIVQIPAGYIIDIFGFIIATWICFSFSLLAILYITIPGCLYESHKNYSSTDLTRTQLFRKLFTDVYNLFMKRKKRKRRDKLMLLYLMYFVTDVIQLSQSDTEIQIVYGLGPPFCWTSVTAGYFAIIFLGSGMFGKRV